MSSLKLKLILLLIQSWKLFVLCIINLTHYSVSKTLPKFQKKSLFEFFECFVHLFLLYSKNNGNLCFLGFNTLLQKSKTENFWKRAIIFLSCNSIVLIIIIGMTLRAFKKFHYIIFLMLKILKFYFYKLDQKHLLLCIEKAKKKVE